MSSVLCSMSYNEAPGFALVAGAEPGMNLWREPEPNPATACVPAERDLELLLVADARAPL